MNSTELAYRKTAVEGTSGFGLLIALYDTLAGNLNRAAEAQRLNDIEKRCMELNHALLVIGYLEDWVDRKNGGELAQKLTRFYSDLRGKLIEAQALQSAELLEQQMAVILSIRGTWQDLEARAFSALDHQVASEIRPALSTTPTEETRNASSWSA